jgi:membrane protease YdiL (CAAX protease family)
LPALLLEAFFYFFGCFPALENRFLKLQPTMRGLLIWASGLAPIVLLQWTAARSLDSSFQMTALALALVCFWHLLLPESSWADGLLLVILTTFILAPWFKDLYPTTASGLKLNALSKLLWLRVGINVFLYIRKFPVPRAGFWPNAKEWTIGSLYFALFLAVLAPAGLALGFLRWQLPNVESWQIPLLAFGYFWALLLFLAYGEEFMVRGVLQQLLTKAMGGSVAPLLLTSLLFGAIHLGFRDQFPNWRFAAVSALAGVFYGLAFRQARSLRSAMVTHALTVTVWNMCFARSL